MRGVDSRVVSSSSLQYREGLDIGLIQDNPLACRAMTRGGMAGLASPRRSLIK